MGLNYGFYFFIFALKIMEHSIFAVKTAMITSGQRKFAAFISFFEILIWGIGTGSVVTSILDDYFVLIPFLLGGQIGLYLGMVIEGFVSKRDTVVIGITHAAVCNKTAKSLRENEFGVTILDSEDNTKVLVIATKKYKINKVRKILKEFNDNASIVINPAGRTIGGFMH